ERDIGADPLRFERANVAGRGVLGISDDLLRLQLAPEHRPVELIQEDGVLRDVTWSHEGVEDDPRPATVDQVVRLIAEDGTPVAHGHGAGIGVGATDFAITDALIGTGGWPVRIEAAGLQ